MLHVSIINSDLCGKRMYEKLLESGDCTISRHPATRNKPSVIIYDRYSHAPGQFAQLQQLLEHRDDVPVVVVGDAAVTRDAERACCAAGVYRFFHRPIMVEEFESCLYGTQSPDTSAGSGVCAAQSPITEVYEKVKRFAPRKQNVVIYGESGTGKERIARSLHEQSDRRDNPFVALNCGAIPESLFESDLFGVVKGAYTGAQGRSGAFQSANGGTLFLDEISEMPLSSQASMLRTLESGMLRPVGSDEPVKVTVRVVAATNKLLWNLVEQKQFRQDLYFRLVVYTISLPPLRERTQDIKQIVSEILDSEFPEEGIVFTRDAIQKLQEYDWPGNIRELYNVVQRAVVSSDSPEIRGDDIDYCCFAPASYGMVRT